MAVEQGPPAPSAEAFRKARDLARVANRVAHVALVVWALAIAAGDFAGPTVAAFSDRPITPDWAGAKALFQVMGLQAVSAAPSILFLCALWDLSAALGEYEQGRFFSLRSSKAVRSAGEWALWAIAADVFAPTIRGWIEHQPGGLTITVESYHIGVAAFAAFVMLIGRVLEGAAAIKAENDAIV